MFNRASEHGHSVLALLTGITVIYYYSLLYIILIYLLIYLFIYYYLFFEGAVGNEIKYKHSKKGRLILKRNIF